MNQGLRLDRLAKDTILNILRQVTAIVIGIAISIILARGLGAEERGVYALASLLPTLVVTFTNFGLAPATAYYVALGKYEKEKATQANFVLSLWIGVASILIGLLVTLFFHNILFKDVPLTLLYICLMTVPATLLTNNLQSISQGIQDFKTYNIFVIVPQIFMLVMFYVLIWEKHLGALGAVWTYLASAWVSTAVLSGIFLRRLWQQKGLNKLEFSLRIDRAYAADVFSYGIKSHLSNIVAFLNYRADTFLLNFLAGASAVGIYGVSVGIAEKLWILSGAVSTVIFPRIASLESAGNKREQLTPIITRHVTLLSVLMIIPVGILSNWFIALLYGPEFLESSAALRWLLPGIFAVGTSRILANDIAGRGYPQINLQQSILAFIVNFTANIILIPRYGASGASMASSISYSFLAILKTIVYGKISGVHWRHIWLPESEDVEGWKTLYKLVMSKIRGKPVGTDSH